MFNNSKAIVIRSFPFKDNKCISKIYTRRSGIITCIVSKKKPILTQPLTILDLTYRTPKTSSFVFIKDAHVEYIYHTLNSNYEKLGFSILISEILSKSLNDQNTKLFDFIINSLMWMDKESELHTGCDSLFLIKLCEMTGVSPCENLTNPPLNHQLSISEGQFIPNNQKIKNNNLIPARESIAIYNLSLLDFDDLKRCDLDKKLNNSMFHYLTLYLSNHLADLSSLKSIKIINDIV